MTIEILKPTREKGILEEYDYEQKIRVLSFNDRVDWFIDNKKFMTINEKWDAFYDICEDYDDYSSGRIMQIINMVIRKQGLSVRK